MIHRMIKWILGAGILAFLVFYPKFFGLYFTNVFVNFAIFALYAVSFNLLLGYTGLFSFGHAMYFGAGGYATALALTHIKGCPLLMALLIGLLGAVSLSMLICPIVIRVGGAAFAMLHLAFSMLIHTLVLKLRNITGGEDGIGGFPLPPLNIPEIVSINMNDPLNFYYFAILVIGVSLWVLWFLTKTPFGQIMVGVRDNAKRVDYMGFKVPQTKAVVYAFAAGFAGIAGSVLAMFQNLVAADTLSVQNSFKPILITMVGGTGSFWGPIWGSTIFSLIEEVTSRYIKKVELLMGLILIVVIMFFPKGFAGFLDLIRQRWFGASSGRTSAVEDGS
jgi:branched-chain amino acid transport system permease protein